MKRSHIWLATILLFHAWYGALQQVWFWNYAPDGDGEGLWMVNPFTYWVPLFSLLFLWYRADSKARALQFSLRASLLASILFPIGVPYYFSRTYSRRGALLHTGLLLVFAATCFVVGRLGNTVAFQYYAVWTNK